MSTDVVAPTRAEAMRELADAEDIGCPPNADAECQHCGVALGDHAVDGDPTEPRTPLNAVCLDDTALLQRRVVWNRFELADGESLVCPHVIRCSSCDGPICVEHSPEFVTCVDTGDYHHADCEARCLPCMHSASLDGGR